MNVGALIVAGVARDTRHYGLDADPQPSLYLPIEALPFNIPMAHMAVRMAAGVGPDVARQLREAVWNASPNLPVPVVRSMDDWLEIGTAERRFDSALFGSFGLAALLLAAPAHAETAWRSWRRGLSESASETADVPPSSFLQA